MQEDREGKGRERRVQRTFVQASWPRMESEMRSSGVQFGAECGDLVARNFSIHPVYSCVLSLSLCHFDAAIAILITFIWLTAKREIGRVERSPCKTEAGIFITRSRSRSDLSPRFCISIGRSMILAKIFRHLP